jgi:tetratricopeptide (TPR) repeat protein
LTLEELYTAAIQDVHSGQYMEAIRKLELFLTHEIDEGDKANICSLLGGVYLMVGSNEKGVERLVQALAITPNNPAGWSNLSEGWRRLGRLDDAVETSRKAIALKPDFAEAHSNLGVTLQKLGRLDEAEASLKQAIALKPDYAEAYYNLGVTLQELDRLDEAEVSLKKAIALKPDFAEAHNNLGVTLKKLVRLNEAEASCRQAIALKPDFAEAHSNLGSTLQELGRLDEAEASYKQAIVLKPDYAEAHYNLGITLQALGILDEAEASCRQAIALKPDYAEAHNNLGATLKDLGRLDEAESSLRQATALKPDFPKAHTLLGKTLHAMGSQESALKHFEKSLQLIRGMNPVDLHHKSFRLISNAKLDHDIEQFEYLASSGYDASKFQELVMLYQTVKSEINHTSDTDVLTLTDKHQRLLRDTYNRPIHILKAPALDEPAVEDTLDVNKITENYFEHEFGLTYVDDFLSPTALKCLREFLLGSTIWYDLFHKGGYMGAYLEEGLASPLVLQIAEDLRKKFPKIFKNHHLNHFWAYKYDSRASKKDNSFKGINIHADFAAINVNFWITPSSANLDPLSGGLVVYNAEAPIEWDFNTYNNNEEKIREEILKSVKGKTTIPYNENRAVIFNSNLFHETDNIDFKDGYENRRINVTMLFGRREL